MRYLAFIVCLLVFIVVFPIMLSLSVYSLDEAKAITLTCVAFSLILMILIMGSK